MSTAILFGLVSALTFGASDVFARFAGRSTGVIRSIFYGHAMAAVALGLAVLWLKIPQAPRDAWLVQVCANVLALAATACLYRALTVGRFGVVSPIAATYGGVSALLSLLSGEALTMLGWFGIATTFGGGLLAATPRRQPAAGTVEAPAGSGAALAAIAALLYGVSFWWQGRYSVPSLGVLIPTWSYYTMGAVFAFAWESLRGPRWTHPTSLQLQLALATTGFACIGSLALCAGQLTGQVAIATLLSALASAVTVLIARVVLKEHVPVHGWVGLALVIAGLAALRLC